MRHLVLIGLAALAAPPPAAAEDGPLTAEVRALLATRYAPTVVTPDPPPVGRTPDPPPVAGKPVGDPGCECNTATTQCGCPNHYPACPCAKPAPGVPAPTFRAGPAFDPDHRCDRCGTSQYVVSGRGPRPGTHTHSCARCGNVWWH